MKDERRIEPAAAQATRRIGPGAEPRARDVDHDTAPGRDGAAIPAQQIDAVVFDYGQVLSLPLDPESVVEMSRLTGIPETEFLPAYLRPRLRYDRGEIASREYWELVTAPYHRSLDDGTLERLFLADVRGWMRVRTAMVAWSDLLRACGVKTAILSNMPDDHMRYIVAHFDWIARFEVRVFSCSERLVKPEPAIFKVCTARLGLAPDRCLFIDDIAVNVEAARAYGLHGIVFEHEGDLASRVARFRGLPQFSAE